MPLRPRFLIAARTALGTFAALLISSPMTAQLKEVNIEKVSLQGTILRVSSRQFQMRGSDGRIYTIDVENSGIDIAPAIVTFDFQEEPRSLKPGLNVRFEADFDGRRLKGKVKQVEVLGSVVDSDYGRTPIHDFRDPADPDATAATDPCLIVGRVKRYLRGRLSVEIPRARGRPAAVYQAKLTDDASVVPRSMRFARPGYPVKVTGETELGGSGLFVWATQVHVTRGDRADPPAAEATAERTTGSSAPPPDEAGPKTKVRYRGQILKIN